MPLFTMTTQTATYGSIAGQTQTMTLSRTARLTLSGDSTSYSDYGTSSPPTSRSPGKGRSHPPNNQNSSATIAGFACDTFYYWRAYGETLTLTDYGGTKTFRTHAVEPTLGTPSLSGETASSVTVDCNWTPATVQNVTATVQYKKSSDPDWTTWGSVSDTANGYSSVSIDQTVITGLEAETSYQFRLFVNRSVTSNAVTEYEGSDASTSTLADTPTVTTDAATSIGPNAATLNGTVDHNTVDGDLSWRYILTSGYSAPPDDAQGTEVDFASNPITADGSGSKSISGLTADTGYTFWAIYDPTGAEATVYGAAATFTTASNPGAGGDKGDIMIPLQFDGQYGVAKTIYFTLRSPADTDNDNFYSSGAPVEADFKIYHDGAEQGSQSDNAPARVGSTKLYSLVLSAAEMSPSTDKELVNVICSDAAGAAFRDLHIEIRLKQTLSQIDVNADQLTNTSAVVYKGIGSGHGISYVGGATGQDINGIMREMVLLEGLNEVDGTDGTHFELTNMTGVNGTNDYYNGSIVLIVGGTGLGQSRVIVDYVGATKVALVDTAWIVNPDDTSLLVIIAGPRVWDVKSASGDDLSSVPTEASSMGDKVDLIFQRFAFKITQTATLQTWFDKSGSSWATRSVSDNGTTQEVAKLA